jgi:hypothetical protein
MVCPEVVAAVEEECGPVAAVELDEVARPTTWCGWFGTVMMRSKTTSWACKSKK